MRRRDFIAIVGGAATWPLATRAQSSRVSTIGFLNGGTAALWTHLVSAFRKGLGELGFVEPQNVGIEFRWADGHNERLPAMAADLVAKAVDVIVTGGGDPAAVAAKQATTNIPIVFTSGSDPLKSGLIKHVNRPEANVTGISSFTMASAAKRLSLLGELVPSTNIAVLTNPQDPASQIEIAELEAAPKAVGTRLSVLNAVTDAEIESAFDNLVTAGVGGLLVQGGSFFASRREKLAKLASQRKIPAIYPQRESAETGGLMSYGVSFPEVYRRLGVYAARILRGSKPSDLPIWQPDKFELVINLRTAKELGLVIPGKLLAIADEVIE